MENSLDLSAESGLYQATQRGVLFPDGTVVWGDPNKQNSVTLPGVPDSTNGNGSFFLNYEHRVNGLDGMHKSYRKTLERTHSDPEQRLVVLERTVILALGKAEPIPVEEEEATDLSNDF